VDSVILKFIPLALLTLTAIGWYAMDRWVHAIIFRTLGENFKRFDELVSRKKAVVNKEEDDEVKRDFAKLSIDANRSVSISKWALFTRLGVLFSLASAILSVVHVSAIIPLALIAILTFASQIAAAMFSRYAALKPAKDPVGKLLRRISVTMLTLGFSYPVLLLVIARMMLASAK
jgi:hypothetical protein